MTREDVLVRVRQLLDSQSTMVLATADEKGTPAATPLFYVVDDALHLYWLSSPGSRHSANLTRRSEAAISVFTPVMDWHDIRGVQMRGLCYATSGPSILAAYRARYSLGAEFDPVIQTSTFYAFQPRWLRYLDNSVRFGFRMELDL